MAQRTDHHQSQHHHHRHHENHQDGRHDLDAASLGELLDLDGEVLHDYLSEVTSWLRQHTADEPRRIVDLGAGTGTGTVALAVRFDDPEVIAVDASEQMLNGVRAKARKSGIADRVRTVLADLDHGWPALGPVDMLWASNSLHEMSDPDRVFTDISTALRPGGLLAVAEMDSAPRFLPDNIGFGRPGLESRWRSALEKSQQETPSPLGPDWGPFLDRAGFALVAQRLFVIELRPPHPSVVGRYAQAYLRRIRPVIERIMATDDLVTIDLLLDNSGPESLLHRGDLVIRNSRTVWLARRNVA